MQLDNTGWLFVNIPKTKMSPAQARQSEGFQSPLFNHEFSRSLLHTLQPAV